MLEAVMVAIVESSTPCPADRLPILPKFPVVFGAMQIFPVFEQV
jgi:hypothetical protein